MFASFGDGAVVNATLVNRAGEWCFGDTGKRLADNRLKTDENRLSDEKANTQSPFVRG